MNYQAKETQAIMAQLEAEFPVPEGGFPIEWWRARINRHHELCRESHERESRIREAAPELLEALEAAGLFLSQWVGVTAGSKQAEARDAVTVKISAAIAKAKGTR